MSVCGGAGVWNGDGLRYERGRRGMELVRKIDVPVSIKAAEMAERMNINLEGFEGAELTRVEDALVKLYLRYGKKGKRMNTMPAEIQALMKKLID